MRFQDDGLLASSKGAAASSSFPSSMEAASSDSLDLGGFGGLKEWQEILPAKFY
jgi:hypothetical protein